MMLLLNSLIWMLKISISFLQVIGWLCRGQSWGLCYDDCIRKQNIFNGQKDSSISTGSPKLQIEAED